MNWLSLDPESIAQRAAGTAVMGVILAAAFDTWRSLAKLIAILFLANAAGYFVGGVAEANVPGVAGKLVWGLCYGLGFGAGLGGAFHVCQSAARRLRT